MSRVLFCLTLDCLMKLWRVFLRCFATLASTFTHIHTMVETVKLVLMKGGWGFLEVCCVGALCRLVFWTCLTSTPILPASRAFFVSLFFDVVALLALIFYFDFVCCSFIHVLVQGYLTHINKITTSMSTSTPPATTAEDTKNKKDGKKKKSKYSFYEEEPMQEYLKVLALVVSCRCCCYCYACHVLERVLLTSPRSYGVSRVVVIDTIIDSVIDVVLESCNRFCATCATKLGSL